LGETLLVDCSSLLEGKELIAVRPGTEEGSYFVEQATEAHRRGAAFEPAHRPIPLFDSSMILLQMVIQVAVGPVCDLVPEHMANSTVLSELTGQLRGMVTTVIMDGKADDQALFAEFQRQRQMTLLTTPRKNSDHTEARRQMIHILNRPKNRKLRQQRGQTVEPMQGVVKDIFALERCWMRGHRNNRWLFAAMGVAVQLHQAQALQEKRSTWKIKHEVLGL
jgi:hypothetical protein